MHRSYKKRDCPYHRSKSCVNVQDMKSISSRSYCSTWKHGFDAFDLMKVSSRVGYWR